MKLHVVLACTLAIGSTAIWAADPPNYSSQKEPHNLLTAEVSNLERKALDGSWRAANRLSAYYMYYKWDAPNRVKWFTIAAENGSHSACSNLAKLAEILPDPEVKRRSAFWAKQLANGKCPEQ
jgi:TPR repeat protein